MASEESKKKRSYRNWKGFLHKPGYSFPKLRKRSEAGLCLGCGKSPCECKNPRPRRGN